MNQSFPVSALDVVLMGAFDPGQKVQTKQGENRKAALETLDRLEMVDYADKKSVNCQAVSASEC
jgi:ABC-type Mn2+/Zn2+ transport system ATPase subunit